MRILVIDDYLNVEMALRGILDGHTVTGGACRGGDRHRGHLPELRHHQLVLQSTQPLTACDLVSH